MHAARLLCELIALPSVNPAFLPAGHPHAGEHQVCDFLIAATARMGLDIELQEVAPRRQNLLARLTPMGRVRQRIVLAPHLDTVGAGGEQFVPRQTHTRIYGRGACDTKGSIAAMLAAIAQVAGSSRRPATTEVLFAGLVDEENGQRGSRALAASGLKADLAIVGEPTRLQVVTAHKGDLWLRLETRGKAAHGARPELGRNAVHAMARVVQYLETTYARQLKRRSHSLLGHATVNVGAIAGGTQPNIVPDRCTIDVDRRTLPEERDADVVRHLRLALRTNAGRTYLADLKGAPCPPLETDPRIPLVRQLMASAGQRRPVGVDFFCDASILAAGGIPSVVFGPGDIAQAHTAAEWVSLRSLQRAADTLADFLRSLP